MSTPKLHPILNPPPPPIALLSAADEAALQLRPFNQRIELPNADDFSDGEGGVLGGGGVGGAGGGVSGDDDMIHDLDEDDFTRDKVKKAASQVKYDVTQLIESINTTGHSWTIPSRRNGTSMQCVCWRGEHGRATYIFRTYP